MNYNKTKQSLLHLAAHWRLIAISIALVMIVTLLSWLWPTAAKKTATAVAVQRPIAIPLAITTVPAPKKSRIEKTQTSPWRTITIYTGASFAKLATHLGLRPIDVAMIININKQTRQLQHLKPGQELEVMMSTEGQLHQIRIPVSATKALLIKRVGKQWKAINVSMALESHVHYVFATIKYTFDEAARQAGLDHQLTHELVTALHRKVNFARGVHPGDTFTLSYNDYYLNDHKVAPGHILAAAFTHHNDTVQMVRFTDPKTHIAEYYTPDGHSLDKSFLRVPLRYTRVSSPFGSHRFHPILHFFRPHEGVDLAAPRGTPIQSVSDGVISFEGRDGGYGKTVVIQHTAKYSTLYAHMSNYVRGIHVGSRVKLGEVIGFVGSTGLATGPHLHFEFRIFNQHVDPMTIRLPNSSPISRKYLARFHSETQPRLAQLKLYRLAQLANHRKNA